MANYTHSGKLAHEINCISDWIINVYDLSIKTYKLKTLHLDVWYRQTVVIAVVSNGDSNFSAFISV